MSAEHMGWPFGQPPTDQDSVEEVADCVAVAASYRPGDRRSRPEFGCQPAAFRQGGVDLPALGAGLAQIEPRAGVLLSGNDPLMMARLNQARVQAEVST